MSKIISTPSCGLTMLRAPEDTFDYVLHVTSDDKHFIRIHCHKSVLRCHSPRLSDLMTGANYSELEVKLGAGFFGAFIELIQYMYLRDITLISHKQKVLKLCAMFDMPFDIFLIRTQAIQPINTYRSLAFTISDSSEPESTCITAVDFLKHIELYNSKLQVAEPISNLLPLPVPSPPIQLYTVVAEVTNIQPELEIIVEKKDDEICQDDADDELLIYQSDEDKTYRPTIKKKKQQRPITRSATRKRSK